VAEHVLLNLRPGAVLLRAVLYAFVQESPRWLLVRGRKQDAMETLRQIASPNGNSVTSSFSMLHACIMPEAGDGDAGDAGNGVFDTLRKMWERPWALRRLAAIMTASFGIGLVYYGMPLNVGNLGSNLYLSVTYNALAELPASLMVWLFIGRINRRISLVVVTVAAGVLSLACVAIPQGAARRMASEIVSFCADVHGVQRLPHLLHRAVPDVRAQLGRGAGAPGAGARRRRGARARRARPREELLVVRRVRALHRLPRPFRGLPPRDEGQEHVRHHGGGGGEQPVRRRRCAV
jgi:hypothetical protein